MRRRIVAVAPWIISLILLVHNIYNTPIRVEPIPTVCAQPNPIAIVVPIRPSVNSVTITAWAPASHQASPPVYGPTNVGEIFRHWRPELLIPGNHTPSLLPQTFCRTRPTRPDVIYQLPEKPSHPSMLRSVRPPRDVQPNMTDPVVIYIHGGDNLIPEYMKLELMERQNDMQGRFQIKCPIGCSYTRRGDDIEVVDAVVHLGINDDGNPFLGRAKRLNIKWHDETPWRNQYILGNPNVMKNFDLVWFWHRNADILGPSQDDKFYDDKSHYTDEPNLSALFCSPNKKLSSPLAVCVIGACQSGNDRNKYIDELRAAGLSLDFFGGCGGTPRLDGISTSFDLHNAQYNSKIQKISEYRFYLAFENHNMVDWVTEKVFQGLIAHTLPIYMGASNIDEFVPPHSIVKTRDFASPKALVEYISYLASNDTEYFEWKKKETWSIRSYMLLNSKRYHTCGGCLAVQAERNRLKAAGLWETTTMPHERRNTFKMLTDEGIVDVPF